MRKQKIEEGMRQRIAVFLPDAIARALTSYHRFSRQEAPDEAKEFSAHHNACKVAIAHIELLIKLARWADLPDAQAENHNQQILLAAVMQEAQGELDEFHRQDHTKEKEDQP